MNTSAKKQVIPELLAAVLWGILTLWTDRLFFRYDWRTTAFFVYKALFVLLAFLLVHGIVTLVKKLRAKNRFVWRWLQWTLPYLAVNLIVLLIVWPACWGNDDLNVLSLARTLQMDAWQHFLTSSAFILSLMFVPIPGGVVLIQNLLISAAVGCFAATAQDLTEKRLVRPVKPVWFAIVYLPFLLPPVLMHNQNPFRTTWSCWCELFLVFMLVAFYLRGTRLTRAELTAVVVLGALAASWRSECVYYLAAIPVMLAVLCCKKLLRPLALGAVTALILCGYMASSRYTGSLMGRRGSTSGSHCATRWRRLCRMPIRQRMQRSLLRSIRSMMWITAAVIPKSMAMRCARQSCAMAAAMRSGRNAAVQSHGWRCVTPKAYCGSGLMCLTIRCASVRTGGPTRR